MRPNLVRIGIAREHQSSLGLPPIDLVILMP